MELAGRALGISEAGLLRKITNRMISPVSHMSQDAQRHSERCHSSSLNSSRSHVDLGEQTEARHYTTGNQRPCWMKSAMRSPMTIVVTLVLARMQSGIIEASATRSPSMPRTLPCWSTTDRASESGPILQVPDM